MASRRTTSDPKPTSRTTAASTAGTPPAAKPATRKRASPATSKEGVPAAQPSASTTASGFRPAVSPQMRRGMIAEAAYLRAERRGFAPGHEEADWLAAEVEVDRLLSADAQSPQ